MVQSRARTVDAYLDELPPERRVVIERIRTLVKRHLKGFGEGMEYGMPYYRGANGSGFAFASQANYVAIYAGEVGTRLARAAGLDAGKSCIRLTKLNDIDWGLVEQIIQQTER